MRKERITPANNGHSEERINRLLRVKAIHLMRTLFTNLTFWVLTAIAAGALLGYISPATAHNMEVLGKGFIKIVTVFIYPIIFLTITLGISGMSNLKKAGKVGGKAIIYFE